MQIFTEICGAVSATGCCVHRYETIMALVRELAADRIDEGIIKMSIKNKLFMRFSGVGFNIWS